MMQFSPPENEVRPGVLITVLSFSYLQQVHPLFLDVMVKLTTLLDKDKHCDLCE